MDGVSGMLVQQVCAQHSGWLCRPCEHSMRAPDQLWFEFGSPQALTEPRRRACHTNREEGGRRGRERDEGKRTGMRREGVVGNEEM